MISVYLFFPLRDKPPSERYIRATSTLSDRSYSIQTNGGMSGPNFISLNDFKINDLELVQLMAELISLKKAVQSCNLESEVPDFETQVGHFFSLVPCYSHFECANILALGVQLKKKYRRILCQYLHDYQGNCSYLESKVSPWLPW